MDSLRASMTAALEADEADDPVAAVPLYIDAAQSHIEAARKEGAQNPTALRKRASSLIERAEELKPAASAREREDEIRRREEELAQQLEELAAREAALQGREQKAARALQAALRRHRGGTGPPAGRTLGDGVLPHIGVPPYWSHVGTSDVARDGFALISIRDGSAEWRGLEAMLSTSSSDSLGKGRDVVQKGVHTGIKLACAWRLQHPALYATFCAGREQVRRDMQLLRAKGKLPDGTPPGLPVETAAAARKLPCALDDEVHEVMLLHGTKADCLHDILSNGPNERYSQGLFGKGTYFAESVGKTDQYVAEDATHRKDSPLHQRLYSHAHHPGHVFYNLACRVTLGHAVRTQSGALTGSTCRSMDDFSVACFPPANTRELAQVGGVEPPVHYHALIAETGKTIARYREFVCFHGKFVYPEYVLAYQRV